MAKFLNTSATNYFLEELIKGAKERLILISPFLKLNDRIKELLTDKNSMKMDVRIIYGKSELSPEEKNLLEKLSYTRVSYCKNLHAKCYINEDSCIITSMNLYEFSQVNNNEMGVLIKRSEEPEAYNEAYEEARRIIRISEERNLNDRPEGRPSRETGEEEKTCNKISSSKLAEKFGTSTNELLDHFVKIGFLEIKDGEKRIIKLGKQIGGERTNPYRTYFVWPEDMKV